MSQAKRQKITFVALLLLAAAASTIGYRLFEGKYIAYHQAKGLFLAGDFKAAIPLFVKALNLGLKSPQAHRHLGDAYLARNDFESALTSYQKYSAQKKDDYPTLGKLAQLYDILGREEEAQDLMQSVLAQHPNQPELWLTLAELYKRRQDFGPARQAYERVLALRPKAPQAMFGLAELYAWQKQYAKALELYRAYLAEHPADRNARVNLARVLTWQGDFDGAIRQYDLALEGGK